MDNDACKVELWHNEQCLWKVARSSFTEDDACKVELWHSEQCLWKVTFSSFTDNDAVKLELAQISHKMDGNDTGVE